MEKRLIIKCPCERKKSFEKKVTIKQSSTGVRSFETLCEVCGEEWLRIELEDSLLNDSMVFRGMKKDD